MSDWSDTSASLHHHAKDIVVYVGGRSRWNATDVPPLRFTPVSGDEGRRISGEERSKNGDSNRTVYYF